MDSCYCEKCNKTQNPDNFYSSNDLGKYPNEGKLFKGLAEDTYVYFVHSFYLQAEEEEIVKATTEYGTLIHASVEKDNLFACQFHPEKSSEAGMQILRNFIEVTKER